MAKLKGAIQLTGSLGELSFYTMRGCEGVVVRRKGGATKAQIRNDASCEMVRLINSEWGGVAKMGAAIHLTMRYLTRLSDYNSSGALNAIAKKIQKSDTCYKLGERPVQLSLQRAMIAGFSFHKSHPFSGVVKVIPEWEIDRSQRTAVVKLPDIIPALHLYNFTRLPFFRFDVHLGVVSDLFYDKVSKKYHPVDEAAHESHVSLSTPWFTESDTISAQELRLTLPDSYGKYGEMTSLVLGIGIEFGSVGPKGVPQAEKYAGSAVILGLG